MFSQLFLLDFFVFLHAAGKEAGQDRDPHGARAVEYEGAAATHKAAHDHHQHQHGDGGHQGDEDVLLLFSRLALGVEHLDVPGVHIRDQAGRPDKLGVA